MLVILDIWGAPLRGVISSLIGTSFALFLVSIFIYLILFKKVGKPLAFLSTIPITFILAYLTLCIYSDHILLFQLNREIIDIVFIVSFIPVLLNLVIFIIHIFFSERNSK